MSRLTVFLARFIGLFAILTVATLVVRGDAFVRGVIANGPVMFAFALIGLAIGLSMILGHNVWSGGLLPVAVTLVGWLILAKGLLLLLLRSEVLTSVVGWTQYSGHPYLYLVPALVLGVYLTLAGFTASTAPGRTG